MELFSRARCEAQRDVNMAFNSLKKLKTSLKNNGCQVTLIQFKWQSVKQPHFPRYALLEHIGMIRICQCGYAGIPPSDMHWPRKAYTNWCNSDLDLKHFRQSLGRLSIVLKLKTFFVSPLFVCFVSDYKAGKKLHGMKAVGPETSPLLNPRVYYYIRVQCCASLRTGSFNTGH